MAQAAISHLRLIEKDAAEDGSAQPIEKRWPRRWTLVFVVGTSTALWSGIFLAVWAAF